MQRFHGAHVNFLKLAADCWKQSVRSEMQTWPSAAHRMVRLGNPV